MITLNIEALSSKAEGIARMDGVVHFVPRALPGEQCTARVVKVTSRWRRAHAVDYVHQSGERISPACSLYDQCGGCQLQHTGYSSQCAFKVAALKETLRRIGHLEIEPEPMITSPEFGYRRKVTFSVERSLAGVRLCLHRWDAPWRLVPVPSCLQLESPLNACLPELETWLNSRHMRWVHGNLSRVVVRLIDQQCAVILQDGQSGCYGNIPSEVSLPEAIGAAYLSPDRPNARLHALATRQDAPLHAGAFRQANQVVADALYDTVMNLAGDDCRKAIDAYCGAGEMTLRLAQMSEQVIGIELNRDAVEAACDLTNRMSLSDRVRFEKGKTEFLLQRHLPADLVVLDPPRSGCEASVLDALIKRPPARLAYISCHPAALARDLRRLLDGGFQLERVVPFDMFPQTYHLEVLVVLSK